MKPDPTTSDSSAKERARRGDGTSVPAPRHCERCGGLLARRHADGRMRWRCRSCGVLRYENPAPAAAAIVLRGREILLVRRRIPPHAGTWALPAGYEEVDEEPEETVRREVAEETGLRVRVLGLYDLLLSLDPRKTGLLAVFLCEPAGGSERPGSDADRVAWFDLDALPDRIGFEENRRVIERLARDLERGEVPLARPARGEGRAAESAGGA